MSLPWCLVMGPPRHPTQEELVGHAPPGQAYLINPQSIVIQSGCRLAPGHDGPHDWEPDSPGAER